jgi:hypothetical protein
MEGTDELGILLRILIMAAERVAQALRQLP